MKGDSALDTQSADIPLEFLHLGVIEKTSGGKEFANLLWLLRDTSDELLVMRQNGTKLS